MIQPLVRALREANAATSVPEVLRPVEGCAECARLGEMCAVHRRLAESDTQRGGAPEARRPHEQEEAGSIPAPATRSLVEAAPISARPERKGTGYDVVILEEGMGNTDDRNVYARSYIEDVMQRGLLEGLQAFADHPDQHSERGRPERSIRDLVGSYHDAYLATSESGALQLRATLEPIRGSSSAWFRDLVESALERGSQMRKLVGISIRGTGAGRETTWDDGQPAYLIERAGVLVSADVVTMAGAGGGFLRRLTESLRSIRTDDGMRRLSESLRGLGEDKEVDVRKRVQEALRKLREAGEKGDDAGVKAAMGDLEKAADALPELKDTPAAIPEATATAPTGTETTKPQPPPSATPASYSQDAALARAQAERDAAIAERDEARRGLNESQSSLGVYRRTELAMKVMRESEVPEGLREATLPKLLGVDDEAAMKRLVEADKALIAHVRETFAMPAGAPAYVPAAPAGHDGARALREAGIPTKSTPATEG